MPIMFDKQKLLHTTLHHYTFVWNQGCGSGSGPFSVEVEAEAEGLKFYRLRFPIGYLTSRETWRKSFVHFPMWTKR